MTRWLRLLHAIGTAVAAVLAVHVFVILVTGGYAIRAGGRAIGGGRILAPTALLLTIVLAGCWLRARRRAPGTAIADTAVATVFLGSLVVYLVNGTAIGSGDTLPARYLPLSILREGNFDLDEFVFLYDGTTFRQPYFVQYANGHFVSNYPVGAALLAVPFYVPSALGTVDATSPLVADLEKLAAAAIVALSAAVLFLTLRRLTTLRPALAITVAYALGTSSLSESSQALWQHGPSQLALAAALYCLVRARTAPRWAAFAGFPLAFAVVARPTDVLVVVPLALYVLVHHRRQAWGLLLTALPAVAFQLWYNTTYFGDPTRAQFVFSVPATARDLLAGAGVWTTPLAHGLAGTLFSPARGLFVYSPVLLFSIVGLALAWRRGGDVLLRYAAAGVVLTVLVYARWAMWWGGFSYGPRLLADLAPTLALALYPLGPLLRASRALRAIFIALLAWSVAAHAVGAFGDDRTWNDEGHAGVDRFPARLWSWRDNQLVNGPRDVVQRVLITALGLPTSRSAPGLLSASYQTDAPAQVTVTCGEAIPIRVWATNVGRAAWLAHGTSDVGIVKLGWRWHVGAQPLVAPEGRARLASAVRPGGSHEFWASIPGPGAPGAYGLEVGLVDEHVLWLADRGSTPVRVTVTVVAPAPRFPSETHAFVERLAGLRVVADHPPRAALSTDRPRYRRGDLVRLTVTGAASQRSWLIDAYLLLRSPDGAIWFHDGQRLLAAADCAWVPLATAVDLQAGHASGGRVDVPTAPLPPGAYTWYLLITEAGRYRVVSEVQTSFGLGSEPR